MRMKTVRFLFKICFRQVVTVYAKPKTKDHLLYFRPNTRLERAFKLSFISLYMVLQPVTRDLRRNWLLLRLFHDLKGRERRRGFTAQRRFYSACTCLWGDWRASRATVKARVRTRDLAVVSVHPLVCDLTNSPVLVGREEGGVTWPPESKKLTNANYKYLKREHFESLG